MYVQRYFKTFFAPVVADKHIGDAQSDRIHRTYVIGSVTMQSGCAPSFDGTTYRRVGCLSRRSAFQEDPELAYMHQR